YLLSYCSVLLVLLRIFCTTSASMFFLFFFFNDPPTTEIYTLSLHDALPILSSHVLNNPFKNISSISISDVGQNRHVSSDGVFVNVIKAYLDKISIHVS